jgi:DNA-binding HxlR family transcriptional regulator
MTRAKAAGRTCDVSGRASDRAPALHFISCPVKETLGSLGQRWTLLILRDIGVYGKHRFSMILQGNPGLTPRVLSRRLRDLLDEGLIHRTAVNRKDVIYTLTPKGRDTLPILAAIVAFGITHHADRVFSDGIPRSLPEAFPFAQETLRELVAAGARASTGEAQLGLVAR